MFSRVFSSLQSSKLPLFFETVPLDFNVEGLSITFSIEGVRDRAYKSERDTVFEF